MKNVAMHTISGFLLGFSAAFVTTPTVMSMPELQSAIYGACVIGLYGAFKEVASYIETITTSKTTAAGKDFVPLSKRLL